MKQALSSVEIHHLVKELGALAGAKMDKIFQSSKKTLLFQLHKSGVGKLFLRTTDALAYVTEHKEAMPQRPLGFAVFLRKYLDNARIQSISQFRSQRIIDIQLEKKATFHLMIELFGGGNVILCDENYVIINPLERQEWKDRSVRKGKDYSLEGIDAFSLDGEGFIELLKKSGKKNISVSLAMDLGLGGTYAKEVCLRAGVDPLSDKPDSRQLINLFKAFRSVLDAPASPAVIRDGEKVVDIVPIELSLYDGKEKARFETFSKALDSVLSERIQKAQEIDVRSKVQAKLGKSDKMIMMQEAALKKLEKRAAENQRKGELLYEHYQEVAALLDGIKKARESYSWKEIKEKLKEKKMVKKVDEKKGTVILSLE